MQKLLLWALVFNAFLAHGQKHEVYKRREFVNGDDKLPYRILFPLNYDPHKKYPVIIILHGSGERGFDNELPLTHGSKLFADSANRKKYPAFVIFPQCPRNDFWARRDFSRRKDSLGGLIFRSDLPMTRSLSLVSILLDSLVSSGNIDTKKVYIGGLSMGGMGTFELLWRKPNFFAAAFPICGGGDPAKTRVYAKNFPIWVFHGEQDRSVAVGNSRLMVNHLKATGAKVKYSEYPNVAHNSWDYAFAEPNLLPWLFEQEK